MEPLKVFFWPWQEAGNGKTRYAGREATPEEAAQLAVEPMPDTEDLPYRLVLPEQNGEGPLFVEALEVKPVPGRGIYITRFRRLPLENPPGSNGKDEWNQQLRQAKELLEQGNNLLILGQAGTGKSTFIMELSKMLDGSVARLAFTGIAAYNIKGETIHSFFHFSTRYHRPNYLPDWIGFWKSAMKKREKSGNDDKKLSFLEEDAYLFGLKFRKLDYLFIDEISMVRADLLQAINNTLTIVKNNQNPFGGVTLVFSGDMYQLPPVLKADRDDLIGTELLREYESPYFFGAPCMKRTPMQVINLKKIYRQEEDAAFGDWLQKIRYGENLPEITRQLNQLCFLGNRPAPSGAITLCFTNYRARAINQDRLNTINEQEHRFEATVKDDFPDKLFPTEKTLILKKGARVMALINKQSYQNGMLGIVTGFDTGEVLVRFDNGVTCRVTSHIWQRIIYVYNKKKEKLEEKITGSFQQIPLALGWAITVHKSQGKTFNQVLLTLETNAFSPGQVYVALSRCKSLDGLRLARKLRPGDIFYDPVVHAFEQSVTREGWHGQTREVTEPARLRKVVRLLPYNEDVPHDQPYSVVRVEEPVPPLPMVLPVSRKIKIPSLPATLEIETYNYQGLYYIQSIGKPGLF